MRLRSLSAPAATGSTCVTDNTTSPVRSASRSAPERRSMSPAPASASVGYRRKTGSSLPKWSSSFAKPSSRMRAANSSRSRLAVARWLLGSKRRSASSSSPKYSSRTPVSNPGGNRSTMSPRTENSPGAVTSDARCQPSSASRAASSCGGHASLLGSSTSELSISAAGAGTGCSAACSDATTTPSRSRRRRSSTAMRSRPRSSSSRSGNTRRRSRATPKSARSPTRSSPEWSSGCRIRQRPRAGSRRARTRPSAPP